MNPRWNPSESNTITVSCPQCRQETSFEIWTVLNAEDHPKEASQLISGTLTDFTCPHCKYRTLLSHPSLFVDSAHNLMIYNTCDDEEMKQQAERAFIELLDLDLPNKELKLRIVNSTQELTDKAALFAAGFDDRPMEALKLSVLGYAQAQERISDETPCSVFFTGADNAGIHFQLRTETESFVSSISEEAYMLFADALVQEAADTAPAASSDTNHSAMRSSFYIDANWALSALEKISS